MSEDTIPDTDPFAIFDDWFAEAQASEPNDPNAMCLATATPAGIPSARDDIAAAVVYLASPAARWVTGRNLLVAGGRTQRGWHYTPPEDE